jgi:hypothetical protein
MFTQEPAPGFMARAPIPIIVGGKPHDYDHRTGDSTVTISMEDRVL